MSYFPDTRFVSDVLIFHPKQTETIDGKTRRSEIGTVAFFSVDGAIKWLISQNILSGANGLAYFFVGNF